MFDTSRRLLALLRLLEGQAAPFGALGDDALLDAWFGRRSPAFETPADADAPDSRHRQHP
jgi:hypothetical protein